MSHKIYMLTSGYRTEEVVALFTDALDRGEELPPVVFFAFFDRDRALEAASMLGCGVLEAGVLGVAGGIGVDGGRVN